MNAPISIRLDADVRETLEAEANARGIGLATYLRQWRRRSRVKPAEPVSGPGVPRWRAI